MTNFFINVVFPSGVLLILIALVIFIIRATWKISEWKTTIEKGIENLKDRFSDLEKRFSGLERRFSESEKRTDRRFDALEKRTDQRFAAVDQRFSEVIERIRDIESEIRSPQDPQPRSGSRSPRTLTESGKDLAKKMDASSLAERYIDELTKQAEERDMSPYQIQELCEDFAYGKVRMHLRENDKEQYRKLEDVAYNEGVHLSELMHVLSLVLRDHVLEALGKEVPS